VIKKLKQWKSDVDLYGNDKSDCHQCHNHSHGKSTNTEEKMISFYDVLEVMSSQYGNINENIADFF
jgi:hypothetical protein